MEKIITPDAVISALMSKVCKDSDFPIGVFPAKLQRIIMELQIIYGFPADYTASAMLAAMSVAIGNSHHIEMKRTWHESAILYIAIVGRPGACKSHPVRFAMKPLVNADWKHNQNFRRKYAEYQETLALSRAERIKAGHEQFPREPKRQRYLVSDVTQEGLSAIHANNPRGLCLWLDELSAWVKNFTRYNSGSEEQFWLTAFNGGTTMSDRKSSQNSIFIKRPFISVIGTIQKKLLTDLANGERASNGFIDRILFAMTKMPERPRWGDDDIREDLERDWENVLAKLLSVECKVDEELEPMPIIVRIAPDAKEKLYAWQHDNADRCDKEMSDNVVSFFCKLEIYVLRFCLLLRMARWAVSDEPESPREVEMEDAIGAIELAEYFRANALSVLTCICEEKLNDLHRTVYERLPQEFSTAEGIGAAARFGMKDHTFKMFLSRNLNTLFRRVSQGHYQKISCYSANNVTPLDISNPADNEQHAD